MKENNSLAGFFSLAYLERKSAIKIAEFIADNSLSIMEPEYSSGFNPSSGYVYCGVERPSDFPDGDYDMAIVSAFGHDAEVLVTDSDTGEESFFDSMEEARKYLEEEEEEETEDDEE